MTFSAHAIEKAISGTQIQCSSLLVGLRWLALYSSSHCARFLIGDSLPGLQLDADSMSPPSCPLDSKSRPGIGGGFRQRSPYQPTGRASCRERVGQDGTI